jgi:Protein of unknown function (DUF1549)/Protein of unknown function (DUF1553)
MRTPCTFILTLALPVLLGGRVRADEQLTTPAELARKVDQLLAKGWADAGVKPAPVASDAEFLRRVYLDLAGRIPSVTEARTFLGDTRPDRRQRLEELLASPRYATNFSNFWRAILIPEASNNFLVRAQQPGFDAWLRKQLAANVGYDRMTRELLMAPMGGQGVGALISAGSGDPTPAAFFFAKEFKPESLAASTARVFLGVSVECAQCHNHPFADWKREQFWSFAAFFSGIEGQRFQDLLLPGRETPDKKELTIPGTETVVQAKYLDATTPRWKEKATSRGTLADWVATKDNPYFSRTAVNRMWAYFLGTGMIEPVDDMIGPNRDSGHTALLDLLAREFAAHQFDVKFLIRTITATKAYQTTSAGAVARAAESRTEGGHDPAVFARMPLRGLTGEQLFDSLAMATGYRDAGNTNEDLLASVLGGSKSARGTFVTKFANQTQRPTQSERSILQALALMNGKVIADATSLEHSETLGAVVDAPFLSTRERIETLYMATLSRQPSGKELQRAVQFVESAARQPDRSADTATIYQSALADVFWALLNSSEFSLNH